MTCAGCGNHTALIPCDHAEMCAECRTNPGCTFCQTEARLGI